MNERYFINDQHQENFKRATLRWPAAKADTEYAAACYILAIPMIFEKVGGRISRDEYPTSWILDYLEWYSEYQEEWADYEDPKDHGDLHPEHDAWISRKPFDLTGSMTQLGRLALNLWNSHEGFNLMNCLGSLDGQHLAALKCAIDIRTGHR